MKNVETPLNSKNIRKLRIGDRIFLSGKILTARDQAHKRLVGLIKKGKSLPVNLNNEIIYYVGPAKTAKGKIIGSAGPTTSSRMDKFTIPLLKKGLLGMIGKGRRSQEVKSAIKKYKRIYFLAPAGLGAYLSKKVISKRCRAFRELGPEAIYELEVKDFPLIVGIDSQGRDIYRKGLR